MADSTRTSWNCVWTKDQSGNEYVCPSDGKMDPRQMSASDYDRCVKDATRSVPVGD